MNWFYRLRAYIGSMLKSASVETCCERLQIDCRQGRDCPYRIYGANTETKSEAAIFMRKKK